MGERRVKVKDCVTDEINGAAVNEFQYCEGKMKYFYKHQISEYEVTNISFKLVYRDTSSNCMKTQSYWLNSHLLYL